MVELSQFVYVYKIILRLGFGTIFIVCFDMKSNLVQLHLKV